MKKTYLIPAMQVELAMASQMLAGRRGTDLQRFVPLFVLCAMTN